MPETAGEQLKRAREERKLSLEQVFQATRIAVRYLKGLESDQHEALPSPVQAKGFLRLYAGFLDLPVQTLLDAWDGKLPPDPPTIIVEEILPEAVEPVIEQPVEPEPEEETAQITLEPADEAPIEAAPVAVAEAPTASQVIFEHIGGELRERRESLGLTLPDVEHHTRLRQHYLRAMEDGRMKDLPSLVQGRGMLSNYARFLEMDADALLLRFAEALQERRVENLPKVTSAGPLGAPKKATATTRPPTLLRRLMTPDLLIGSIVIIGLLIFGIWGAAQVSALRSEKEAPTAPPIANVLVDTPAPNEAATTETAEPEATAAPFAPENPEGPAVPPLQEAEPPTGEITPTSLPVVGDAPLQVYVVAKERAWMRVSEDGKVKFNGRVIPGNAYPFSGKDKIELVSGNAAAIQVFFNQNEMGSLGQNEEVVRLIFTLDGVITPTPSFSATPTHTQIPTVTPQPSPTLLTPTITPFIP